jgi:pre-mRNA-processing factor SLU7
MASDRRSEKQLSEARAAGAAPPAIDVKSGQMINPHNPEFITRKPWYLTEGDDGAGPTLDHQADQRREEDRLGISLAEAERLVKEEREKVKRKLERQRVKDAERKKRKYRTEEADTDLFELGMWIEALKKNKKPYLIAQIVKISEKGKCFDLKYEDGKIENNVRPFAKQASGTTHNLPRMRVTRTGNRSFAVDKSKSGKETYDSKRDAYHGVEMEGHMKLMEEKYKEREALRKEQRRREREEHKKKMEEEKEEKQKNGDAEGDKDRFEKDSDSDSDYDSDAGGSKDEGWSSEDEVVQHDDEAKMFTTRLARQGGVGGAQMKVTARNLRIREDTAKYLRNLDPNSAYYDPKSRSMRDNPYANDEAATMQQHQQTAESMGFAGDNFTRISGDAVQLAETQLFAWDAEKKLGTEGVVHVQADPSRAELMRKQVERKGEEIKDKKRKMVLDRYGGEEYLDKGDKTATGEERATRFGVSHAEQEYNRDGLASSSAAAGKQKKRVAIPCKYEEDVFTNGHTAVWGSYFHKGAFKWGFADDHSLIKSSYGTGINGRIANDESNELTYGSGAAGSAMLASARKMLEVIPRGNNAALLDTDKFKPNQQSKLYGEAVDQHKEFDRAKIQEAMKRQREEANVYEGKKKKYNSLSADVNVTEEDMEAYRLLKERGAEDPLANMGDELLEYKK